MHEGKAFLGALQQAGFELHIVEKFFSLAQYVGRKNALADDIDVIHRKV